MHDGNKSWTEQEWREYGINISEIDEKLGKRMIKKAIKLEPKSVKNWIELSKIYIKYKRDT